MDFPESSSESAAPGRLFDALDLIRLHIGNALESLQLATQPAEDRRASRHDVVQHLESASSGLRKIDYLSSQIQDELYEREKFLDERRSHYLWQFEHLTQIRDRIKESLAWIEDPGDPSTSLKDLHNPDDVCRLVDERFRALQNSVEHFSNLNTRLRQDFNKVSQEAARLKEELHTQTKSGQKTYVEKAKLVEDITDAQTQLKDVQEELRREKQARQSMKKRRDALSVATDNLRAELDRANKKLEVQKKNAQQEARHTEASADLSARNMTLSADIRIQTERTAKLQIASRDLETELAAVKATSDALRKSLQDAQNEKHALATANTDLEANKKALQVNLGVQRADAEEAQAEKGRSVKVVAGLNRELEAVREDLRVETGKTCEARKENADQIVRLQASLKAAQTQLEQDERKRTQDASTFEERLKQESAKHEGILGKLKQAQTEKDDLAALNEDLDEEVKALQEALEGEKLQRQRITDNYMTMLETKSVEHADRIQDLAAGHASELSLAQEEIVNAQKETSEVRSELEELRQRTEADQDLIDSLNGLITERTKKREDLAARYNSACTENNRPQNLRKLVKSQHAGKPHSQDCLRSPTFEEPGPQDRRYETGPRISSETFLDVSETCKDVDFEEIQPAKIVLSLPDTSRKRGTAERELDNDSALLQSKRPCLRVDLGRADASTVDGPSELRHTAATPISSAHPGPTADHVVPSIEGSASILKMLGPGVIPQDATENAVNMLLKSHLAELPGIEKEARIRAIATELRTLKSEDFTASVKALLRAVHSYADDETRRLLRAPSSFTVHFLDTLEQTQAITQTDRQSANVPAPEASAAHNLDPRDMELADVSDAGTREKVGHLTSMLHATVKQCYDALRLTNGSADEAYIALLFGESFQPSENIEADLSNLDVELEQTNDDEHARQLQRMYKKWGPFCGVPEPWRTGLKLKDASRRLQSLYNKVEALGEDPVEFLWRPDGLLTRACEASRHGKLNSQTITNASQELREIHPQLFTSKKRRSGRDADDQMVNTSSAVSAFSRFSAVEFEAMGLPLMFPGPRRSASVEIVSVRKRPENAVQTGTARTEAEVSPIIGAQASRAGSSSLSSETSANMTPVAEPDTQQPAASIGGTKRTTIKLVVKGGAQ